MINVLELSYIRFNKGMKWSVLFHFNAESWVRVKDFNFAIQIQKKEQW